MAQVELNRTINISVSIRIDQYQWLQKRRHSKNALNASKLFQIALDKEMKKN